MILRPPYYKGKNCCLNPVARYGIPKYADSRLNPKVKGTPDFEKYWEEQLYYIKNGYQSGGVYITGRFYYYLNFNFMSTINGIITPDVVDLHHELSLLYEYAKSKGKNIIVGKARRKGISEFTHKAVIDYGYRFTYGYNAGIAAGLKDYALDFMTKWSNGDSLMPLELQTKTLISNNDEVQAGYEIQDENNQWIDKGTKNKIHVRTMFNNPNLFKGLYLNDVVAEECGEFPNLIEFYNATEDTLTDGDKQIGTMMFYGCVCAGTKIWDNNGKLINIEDLVPENGIIGFNQETGEYSKENITYWQPPAEKPCYRITTYTGRILECSEDHPILYSKLGYTLGKKEKRKKGLKFVEAKDLKIGDQVATLNSLDVFGDKEMWEARLIGWLIGDGTYGIDSTPKMSNCDFEINDYIETNFDCRLERFHTTKDGKLYKETCIKGICWRLRELGIYGQTKLKKRLPINIDSYSKNSIRALLGGLFDTDGCICLDKSGKPCISLTSSGKELLVQVMYLLQKFGIHGNLLRIKPDTRKNPKNKNPYYKIAISDKRSVIAFHDNIRMSIGYKIDNLKKMYRHVINFKSRETNKGLRFERITNVEFIGMKPIYNLTAGKTNTYVANGIVTHNTAGNVNKGSKDYKYIWEHADEFNMIKFLAPATRFHKPNYGGATRNGEIVEQIPNLLLTHKKFELIGVEDEKAAKEFILKKSDKLAKSGNKKKYLEYKQNNPLEEKDMFRKTAVNEFDTEKLNDQEYIVSNSPKKYSRWKLDWVTDKDTGLKKIPLQIIAKPATKDDKEDSTFLILDTGHPLQGYWGLYSIGADSYDQDTSKTSKSLGAACVLIRANTIANAPQLAPVAVLCVRPKRKEMFYEMCLKLAVYYNAQGAFLVDAAKPQIIKYFEENYGQQYLALRPKKFESSNSEQTHVHGVLLTRTSRPQMVSLMDTAIYYNGDQIWFDELINQLQNFDEVEEGSDNDLADAYGISLMQNASMEAPPSNNDDESIDDMFNLHAGTFDRSGNYHHGVETHELKSDEQDNDLFGL